MKLVVCGTGSALPEQSRENDEIAALVDTSDTWIQERTGIVRRHIAGKETCVSLAVDAAKRALEDADILAEEIELILVSTISSNVVLPCTACEVQREIGAVNAVCYDINAACSGFVLAYQSAAAYLQSGMYQNVLLIGSECLSHLVNWKDRSTCILFGDGAGAAVLQAAEGKCMIAAAHADGTKGDALTCKSYLDGEKQQQQQHPEYYQMQMDGQAVFKFAVRKVPEVIREVMKKNELQPEEIDWVILHQANRRIIEAVRRELQMPEEKFPVNIQEYGNTSSASIPILLDELKRSGQLKTGQKLMIAGFGAGLLWGAGILEMK